MLTIEQIDTYYDQSHVLQGVSLAVPSGSVVGLLGRNGAGKTTTLKSVMGIVPPRRGEIRLAGRSLTRLPPYRVAREGIGYVPEERGIFPSLTVEENLNLARPLGGATERRWDLDRIYELFPRLRERRANMGNGLSGGEQQMLSIARALLLCPRLLILDEPTEGLAPVVVAEIAAVIERLKTEGITMLLVEQNYAFAARLADRLYLLGKGRVHWSGTPAELEAAPEAKHTWLGI